MTHIKCPHCNLINWPKNESCERCGARLEGGEPETHAPRDARSDFPVLTFASGVTTGSGVWKLVVAVIVAVAVGGAVWGFWYKRGAGPRQGRNEVKKQFVPPTPD